MADLVPGGKFLDKKSILVFGKSQIDNIGPWIQFGKLSRMVPQVSNMAENTPGGVKVEK